MNIDIVAPCHFGLEAVLKREIIDLGYEITGTEDGRVFYKTDARGVIRSNINLRTAERVLINVGQFNATTYDELFEGIKALPWERYIPKTGRFWVKKASSVNSALFSPSDIQSIAKKAMVECLKKSYSVDWFEETGADHPVRIFIHKDKVLVTLDTTGESLHKRGYRPAVSKAPISETLAAALIMLTPWKKDRIFADPFTGSGTFPIEAAMMAAMIAPGINRGFLSKDWPELFPEDLWKEEYDAARARINKNIETDICGFDSDPEMIKIAKENAARAGVEGLVRFERRDVSDFTHPGSYGFIVTNPPYGERLENTDELFGLYNTFGRQFKKLDSWSAFFITSYEDAQKAFGGKATKNRKIYNGMIKTYYYQYMGPKPKGKPGR